MKTIQKKIQFNERMGRQKLFKGGMIKRKKYATGAAVLGGTLSDAAAGAALGSVVLPGIGTIAGGVAGGLGGLISGLMSGGGPQMPNIVDPVTGQQITDAQGNVVASQQQLQSFASNLQGVNGVQNQQAVLSQLQGIANGTGPNPAMAQLAQTTGTNVKNTAAELAGQRGASANVGLQGRQIAQQGAATEQQATGQAATLAAQQELAALNSEGQIAGQQVGETQGALNAANNAATTNQGQLLGAQGAYNTNITGGQGNLNAANVTSAGQLLNGGLSLAGSVANAAGTGQVAGNTLASNGSPTVSGGAYNTPSGGGNIFGVNTNPISEANGGMIHKPIPGPHKSHVANYLFAGGKADAVPAMVSPGEVYLSPDKVQKVLHEGANPMKIGEKFPGKPKVKGDSKKNDILPRTLEEGGMVIPNHITRHKMSAEKSELFVHRENAKKRARK